MKKRRELVAKLDAPQLEIDKTISGFEAPLGMNTPPVDRWLQLRWVEKQLSLRRTTDRGRELAQKWQERMRSSDAEELFAALPVDHRQRYLDRIGALLDTAGSVAPGGGAPAPPPPPPPPSSP